MIALAGAERLALGMTDRLDAAGPAALAAGRGGGRWPTRPTRPAARERRHERSRPPA